MKELTTRHFIEYSAGGGMFTEKDVEEVLERDVLPAKYPDWAIAFCFYDILETEIEHEGKKIKLRSEPINKSSKIRLAK